MNSHILYDDGHHKCVAFSMPPDTESVPSNQFLIVDGDESALIDPGGDLTFSPLLIQLPKFTHFDHLRLIFGSHQDPDILASMPRWMLHTEEAQLVISKLWERFLPHYNSAFTKGRLKKNLSERMITIEDEGGRFRLGDSHIIAIPAHFLHSVGNFQFYDPVSQILFSGDMGASLVGHSGIAVTDFNSHISQMEGFHRRYMCSRIATSLWANAVKDLPIKMMVPQHGLRFDGRDMFIKFLRWISRLDCGIDLLTAESYDFSEFMFEYS